MNFEQLYDYWFTNKNVWFNSTSDDDIKITELFGHLFNNVVDENKIKTNCQYGIGVIILYDQVSRHILRAKDEDIFYFWSRGTFINETNKLAINYSTTVYYNFKYELNADEYAFVMLPLRHSFDFTKIKYVMSETWDILKIELDELEKVKYKQFLKATYERSIVQSDDSIFVKQYLKDEEKKDDVIENYKYEEIYKKYEQILDTYHNKMLENPEGVEPELILSYREKIEKNLIKKFKQNFEKFPKVSFIMSISGGVDSMVCSYILKKVKIPFTCVHINYNNRKESKDEENFVIEWCKLLNVNLYVRKINEINRPECMNHNLRELYETYTRDIRYGTYLKADNVPYVILGHNQDDCFENILTNISHKSKYENLNGMEPLSQIIHQKKTINIVRPMLDIIKRDIYEFASVVNIPFLWDSTPKWSQRGKIRDIVRPALESWNSEMVPGLFEISNTLKESLELVDILIDNWTEKILDNKITCEIKILPISKIFWKKFFQKINVRCSPRALNGLIEQITKIKNNQLKIDINAFVKYEIHKDFQIKIMKMKNEIITIFLNNRR